MIVSKLKRLPSLIRKVLDFYGRNGAKTTLYEIQNRMRRNAKKSPPYQSLLNKFPQRFAVTQNPPRNARQWEVIVDSSAQIALQKLMIQLNIPGNAGSILSAFKDSFGEDKYYRILADIFTFEQFMIAPSDGTVYPLIQASELPEVSDGSRRRRILFITSQFPNPYHGGGNRVLNFIKILSNNNDIYLSTCYIPEQDESVSQLVEPHCRVVQKIPYWRFGSNQVEIQEWLKGIPMDVVHYEWPRSLENYDPGFGKIQIFTYMEAVSLRLQMDLDRVRPLSRPWLEKFAELIYALRLELADAAQLTARIAVTTKDGDFFKKLYPYQKYAVLNHGLTFDEFSLPDVKPKPHTLVFVGNYDHYPNVDAMELFFDEMWAAICKEVPDVRIYLVGPNPPEKITRFVDGEHVIVTGGVPDIRPYIQKATIGIAPLISGAGMRGKVIDYAALCRTFVATSLAVTDLVFEDGIDFYCADTAQEFTQKVIALLKDGKIASQMSASAFKTARQNYDNYRLTDFLVRLYEHLEG